MIKDIFQKLVLSKDNVFNVSLEGDQLFWCMWSEGNDDNKYFILSYDFETKEAGWEGSCIPSGGCYYKEIDTIEEFDIALKEWEYNSQNWNY